MKRAIAAVSLGALLVVAGCTLPEQGYNRHVCLPDSAVCWLENPR